MVKSSSRWLRWVVVAGLLWGEALLLLTAIDAPTSNNVAYLFSISGSGLYTLTLYALRRRWLPLLTAHPLRNAALLGMVNAAYVEALFLAIQNALGAQGIAAASDLLLDWLITMPWYVGMVIIFVRVQARWRFSAAVVLLLGAIYETGADGIVAGQVIPTLLGDRIDLLEAWKTIAVLLFWQFIPVYSSMVLPPAWVIDTQPPSAARPSTRAWVDALKPLVWLLPFTIYLIGVLSILSQLR